ncbi:hypothetical protein J2T57_002596 [Natronocella acetinitrilica]|uniref:Tail terminator n=1 Tax=Natronocella acetinitrilica TaxID=414046 RepID=A0AAE3G664_9GAMM|nr:hypothetical protein [Natronocella acetinitrilica]MCP1675446.1 hypothetical protein [Natronocella acetinitrilica]
MNSPDAFAAVAPVVERLKARFSNTVTVDWASEVSALGDIRPLCPAAFVQAGGLQPRDRLADAALVHGLQEVIVTVCIERRDEAPIEQQAQSVMAEVFAALNGWRHPASTGRPLRWVEALEPYFEAGYGEFPQVFAYPVTVGGST